MKKTLFVIILNLCLSVPAFAGGLSTTFGEVLVEDLPIGREYSLEKEASVPLTISNTSSQTVNLKLEVLVPQEGELKEGYEAIPDLSWIRLVREGFTVEPGTSASTDVVIAVPDDRRHSGKKYQVYIWSHTIGQAIGVGLKSRLLFTVRKEE